MSSKKDKAPKPNDAFILVDYKLTAIIGVFSNLDATKEAKKLVIKRDVDAIRNKINEEIALTDIKPDRKYYLVGVLNLINFFSSNVDARWENTFVEFDGISPHTRYGWYKMEFDRFLLDESTFGPIILIPPPKDYNDSE